MTFELSDLTRRRLVEDMPIRGYSDKTRSDYVRVAVDFTRLFGGLLEFAKAKDLRAYQLQVALSGATPSKMNAYVSALRFFFKVTLGKIGVSERLARVRDEDRLPVALSPEEMALILHCVTNLKQSSCSASPTAAASGSRRSPSSGSMTSKRCAC